jgi:hypothetical protein
MACFHPVASIALGYILGYIDFHVGPLEILLQVLVHLGTAGMNRKFGLVSLIEDDLFNSGSTGTTRRFPNQITSW